MKCNGHLFRLITGFVILSFLGLTQIAAMPTAPAGGTAAIAASDEEAPGVVETKAPAYKAKKKGSALVPIIIGVVAVGAIAAVLVLVVFKSYDITGEWDMYDSVFSGTSTIVFTGTKKSGAVSFLDFNDTGTYTVSGKNVDFSYAGAGSSSRWVHTGKFENKDKISGTLTFLGESGTWFATRLATARTTTPQSVKGPKPTKKTK